LKLSLGLCGCGGMGRRHVLGLGKLRDFGCSSFDLVGVCDPVNEYGERLADLAEELLGRRPRVFTSFTGMSGALPGLDAVDVTTPPDFHSAVGVEAFESGLHVMVEKPIALTVEQGLQLMRAAADSHCKLAVAENYRRDPINRLARAIIEAGVLGRPFLAVQSSSGGGEDVLITPWRHLKRAGGIMVDMGIHYADLLEYYLGPIESVVGMNSVVDRQRKDLKGAWHPADAEDLSVGVARFRSGALANWVLNLAGRGERRFERMIYGTAGSLSIPADRTGRPLTLALRHDGREEILSTAQQLALVPDFVLDDTTAALFGGKRLSRYTMEWADIDASLLAIELDDFADSILADRDPEVSGADGLRSLALVYGFLESERLGHIVSVDELLSGGNLPYQSGVEGLRAEVTD
jgi:predicted dehydrogenase